MKKFVGMITVLLLFYSCKKAEWAGRYNSTNCMAVDYVEFYEDNTADIKYYGASFPTNHKLMKSKNVFYVNVYAFELRQDGKMHEISGFEMGCVLVKDESVSFWDKVFQP